MNPVLKKAGVVDAGGKGFLVILEGMLDEPAGRAHASGGGGDRPERTRPTSRPSAAEDITFAFDTVFIVRKTR